MSRWGVLSYRFQIHYSMPWRHIRLRVRLADGLVFWTMHSRYDTWLHIFCQLLVNRFAPPCFTMFYLVCNLRLHSTKDICHFTGYFCPESSTSSMALVCPVGYAVFETICMHVYLYISWTIMFDSFIYKYWLVFYFIPLWCMCAPHSSLLFFSNFCPLASALFTPCPAGAFCPIGSRSPTPCPGGTYGSVSGLQTSICSGKCTAGMIHNHISWMWWLKNMSLVFHLVLF